MTHSIALDLMINGMIKARLEQACINTMSAEVTKDQIRGGGGAFLLYRSIKHR